MLFVSFHNAFLAEKRHQDGSWLEEEGALMMALSSAHNAIRPEKYARKPTETLSLCITRTVGTYNIHMHLVQHLSSAIMLFVLFGAAFMVEKRLTGPS